MDISHLFYVITLLFMSLRLSRAAGKGGLFGGNVLFDTQHIMNHMEEIETLAAQIDKENPNASQEVKDKKSKSMLKFAFFEAHDYNNDKKLDGLEVLKALSDEDNHDHDPKKHEFHHDPYDFQFAVETVDETFDEFDIDRDGYLGYEEYSKAAANIMPDTFV